MGIDLDHAQSGGIDLPSRFFRVGSAPWTSVLGLQQEHYLTISSKDSDDTEKSQRPPSWRQKLLTLLHAHGVDQKAVGRIWLVTMPSYLGIAGINPLSVYFCYSSEAVTTVQAVNDTNPATAVQEANEEDWVDLGTTNKLRTHSKDQEGTFSEGRKLLCVVLEVHNTFEERLVHTQDMLLSAK